MNARGSFAGCVVAALLAVTVGCGGHPEKEFDGKTLGVGETFVEGHDPTADRPISVYLPSGVLKLRVEEQMAYLDDGSKYTFSDLEAADGAELIGIEWELDDLSVYPTDVSEALLAMSQADLSNKALEGGMSAIHLTVDAGPDRIEIPSGDDVTDEGRHAVVGVAEGSTPSLEVEYGGETQVVDLSSGTVESGRAGPLMALEGQVASGKEHWQIAERVDCAGDSRPKLVEIGFSCLTSLALELPYVRGLGWAEVGVPYVLADVHTDTSLLDGRRKNLAKLTVTL
ncbi:MAG: hypothetical protein ACRDPS_08855, partial [Nocardioides sp.]|uniref:hypothetical protein n=1 Tax=Nocardioides sp. TaxID=35761 RepID=UPI003D6A6319